MQNMPDAGRVLDRVAPGDPCELEPGGGCDPSPGAVTRRVPRASGVHVTTVAPKDSILYRHATHLRELCPEVFVSADLAYARLQELKAILSSRGANLRARCFQDSPHGCELPLQLPQWNSVLSHIAVQLRERKTLGELAVVVSNNESHYIDRKCRTERSALLFHWLLTNHHCVTALRVEEWGVLGFYGYSSLFCDGVAKCTYLRNLQLCVELPSRWCYKQLLEAMLSLPHLEEITCGVVYVGSETHNMTILARAIALKAKLNRLKIERFVGELPLWMWCEPPGMSRITAGLRSNAAVSDLCLDVTWLKAEECQLFCQALKENSRLESLHLVGSTDRPTLSVAAIAGFVKDSKALITLQLTRFRASVRELWALARSFSSVGIMQQVALVSCLVFVHGATSVRSSESEYEGNLYFGIDITMLPFFHMMRTVPSLRKLRLPLSLSRVYEWEVLFEALDENSTIEELHIDCHYYPCRVIRETGTGTGWRIESFRKYDPRWAGMFKWERVRNFCVDVFETEATEEMLRRFTQLRMLCDLSSLAVRMQDMQYTIKTDHAEILAQFLRDTKALSEVEMNFFAKHAESLVLLDGLRHNRSITVLIIENWCRSRRTAQLLAEVVTSSKRLRTLTYNLDSLKPSVSFFSKLAKSIHNNFTIISVKTHQLTTAVSHLDRIEEILARNRALPLRAARFVTGRTVEKSGAEALESLGLHPTLVCAIQEMLSLGQKQAEDAIRRTLNELDDMDAFMRAAGVVWQSVVCEESPECNPRFDALPFFSWLPLRRYLRVADVVDQREMR